VYNTCRRLAVVLAAAVAMSALGMGCSQVDSGTVVTCRICGKTLSNDVHQMTVPFWDA